MKFFIPYTESDEQAAKIYEAIKSVASSMGWVITGKRIRRIEWSREDKAYTAVIGQVEARVGEEVIAILEASAYLVCTPSMGVVRGMPLIVAKDEVTAIEYFDEN